MEKDSSLVLINHSSVHFSLTSHIHPLPESGSSLLHSDCHLAPSATSCKWTILNCRGWKLKTTFPRPPCSWGSGCKFDSTNEIHPHNKVRQRLSPTSWTDAVVKTFGFLCSKIPVLDGSFMRGEMQQQRPPHSLFSSPVTDFTGAKRLFGAGDSPLTPGCSGCGVLKSAVPETAS